MIFMKLVHSAVGILLLIAATNYSLAQAKIISQWIQYRSGNDTVKAYLVKPEGDGPFPAILVIHEWWGLSDWVKQDAEEFARRGYVAVAVDLYRGRLASSSDEAH